jgi:hypothetical protein
MPAISGLEQLLGGAAEVLGVTVQGDDLSARIQTRGS